MRIQGTLGRAWGRGLFYGLVLGGVILYAYWGSLSHGHRGDQWWWLVDTMEDGTFLETLADSYSYTRTRMMAPGDSQLYRPLFYMKFAVEKALFGRHFLLWQMAGVVLHFIVCWLLHFLLLELMRLGRAGYEPDRIGGYIQQLFAYVLPLFAGANATTLDAVIWAHINGYLVLYAIVLFALYYGLRNLESLGERLMHWVVIWVVLLSGAFFYEYGQFYGPIAGLSLLGMVWGRMQGRARVLVAVSFCLIPLIYQGANRLDEYHLADRTQPSMAEDGVVERSLISFGTVQSIAHIARYTLVLPHIPYDSVATNKEGRLLVKQPSIGGQLRGGIGQASGVVLMAGWFLFGGIGACVMVVRRRKQLGRCWLTALTMMGLYFLGLAVVRVGPEMNVNASSYYIYWPFLLSLVMAYIALLNVSVVSERYAWLRWCVYGVSVLFMVWIGVLVVVSATMLSGFNRDYAGYFEKEHEQLRQVEAFVAEHGEEAGFSFLFDHDRSEAVGEPWAIGIPWTTILFREYENYDSPKYLVWFEEGVLVSESGVTDDALDSVSYLVQPGAYFNVYRRGEGYFGVMHFEGSYSPRKAYRYLIRGGSVAEVLEQEPDVREAALADFRAGRIKGLISLH